MDLGFLRPLYDDAPPGGYVSVHPDTTPSTESAAAELELRWRAARERLAADGADEAALDAAAEAFSGRDHEGTAEPCSPRTGGCGCRCGCRSRRGGRSAGTRRSPTSCRCSRSFRRACRISGSRPRGTAPRYSRSPDSADLHILPETSPRSLVSRGTQVRIGSAANFVVTLGEG